MRKGDTVRLVDRGTHYLHLENGDLGVVLDPDYDGCAPHIMRVRFFRTLLEESMYRSRFEVVHHVQAG